MAGTALIFRKVTNIQYILLMNSVQNVIHVGSKMCKLLEKYA
jgi:hypothetical protein